MGKVLNLHTAKHQRIFINEIEDLISNYQKELGPHTVTSVLVSYQGWVLLVGNYIDDQPTIKLGNGIPVFIDHSLCMDIVDYNLTFDYDTNKRSYDEYRDPEP